MKSQQARIEALLVDAQQELNHIESLSVLASNITFNDPRRAMFDIFQHTQRGLDALRHLKTELAMVEAVCHD